MKPATGDDGAHPRGDGGRRVLVVDESKQPTRLLEAMLHMAGADDVCTIVDGRLAVDCCLQIRPDLVVVDLDIRQRRRRELNVLTGLRQVLPVDRFLPVVALTNDVSVHAKVQALAAGANDFFTKPLEELDFIERVRNLLTMRGLFLEVQRRNRYLRAGNLIG